MKHIKYICLFILFIALNACNEDMILEEIPKDFTTVENSFTTPANFKASVAQLYSQARRYFATGTSGSPDDLDLLLGTDAGWQARDFKTNVYSQYSAFGSDNTDVQERWERAYKIISNANTIIARIDNVQFTDETQKKTLLCEARFFRAYAYRSLVYLFGDVPLVLEEISFPRRDFVRAPKAEVVAAIIDDLEFARANLPDVDNVEENGRISKDVARHFLAEIYIYKGENQKAVEVASEVIDGGKYTLMTSRFGSRKDKPGDIYGDLFQLNNQNRKSGNTESIWVYQVEFLTLGGYGDPIGDANFWERLIGPEYNRFEAKNENIGVRTFIYESTYHAGRGQGFFRPSTHVTHGIWKNVKPQDFDNDIRNSDHNILRKWWIDNPLSKYYNQTIDLRTNSKLAYQTYLNAAVIENDSNRKLYPVFLKYTQINNHFSTDLMTGNANFLTTAQAALATQAQKDLIAGFGGVGPMMSANARRLFTDIYAARLPETLLLRAEANMNLGKKDLAAIDINKIRSRANASQISSAEVTIDFILDERLRELYLEEPRRLTLNRLGLLYDRTKRYNYYSSTNVQLHNNLYPVPSKEIQNNTQAKLTQNDGYN